MFSTSVHGLSIHMLSQVEYLEAIMAVKHYWPTCKSNYVTAITNKNVLEKIAKLVAK